MHGVATINLYSCSVYLQAPVGFHLEPTDLSRCEVLPPFAVMLGAVWTAADSVRKLGFCAKDIT